MCVNVFIIGLLFSLISALALLTLLTFLKIDSPHKKERIEWKSVNFQSVLLLNIYLYQKYLKEYEMAIDTSTKGASDAAYRVLRDPDGNVMMLHQ